MILLRYFWQICLFKASPADVPTSTWLLKFVLLLYFIIDAIQPASSSLANTLFVSLLDTLFPLVFSWIILRLFGLQSRFVQTATSHAACSAIIGVISLPVLWLIMEGLAPKVLMVGILFVLSIWSILVVAHIYRHALDIGKFASVMFSVAYSISIFYIITSFIHLFGV